MKYIFPKRTLTIAEFLLIPEVFWVLFIAHIKIFFFRSASYLPSSSINPTDTLTPKKFESAKEIAIVINRITLRTPWTSTCLEKVIAAHNMLKKRKIPHTLHFGVKKNPFQQLSAHAWLSVEKIIIIGGGYLDPYTEISQIII